MGQIKIADNFDRATNPHPHPNPTDFEHEIRIRWMWILAGSVTSLITDKTNTVTPLVCQVVYSQL